MGRKPRYLEQFYVDLKQSLRSLRRTPLFTAIAVLIIALGVGANTAMFSVINAVLLRALPYADAGQVVRLFQTKTTDARIPVAPLNFLDVRDASRALQSVAAYRTWNFELNSGDVREPLPGARVSHTLFTTLRVMPAMGRAFLPAEDVPGGPPVAIISDALWRGPLRADAHVLGRPLRLADGTYTVIGVMPPSFWFPAPETAILTPLRLGDNTSRLSRTENYLSVVGRLASGATLTDLQRDLNAVAGRLAQQEPASNAGVGLSVAPIEQVIVGEIQLPLLLLLVAVVLMLLTACADLVLLLVARASARRDDVAVRHALGADRFRLLRQSLTESLALALLGGCCGVAVALWSTSVLRSWLPADLPRREEISIDVPVLLFAFAATMLTTLVAGVGPALTAWKTDVAGLLRGARTVASRRSFVRPALVVAQVSLSCILLVGAGLLMRSLVNVLRTDPGFQPDRLLTMHVSVPERVFQPDGKFEPTRVVQHYRELTTRLEQLPGVLRAGLINISPLTEESSGTRFTIEGRPPATAKDVPTASYRVVSPGYLRAMGARLVRGREFTADDTRDAPLAYIVNESWVRRFAPSEDVLRDRIRRGGIDSDRPFGAIVGVIADMKQDALEVEVKPEIFIPHAQFPWPQMALVVRARTEPSALAASVQQTILQLHPEHAIRNVQTMEELMSNNVRHRRFTMTLLSLFAGLALVLAASGIYGIVSYSVVQRSKEFGIRLALGGTPAHIMRLVLRQMATLILIGGVLGLLLAAWLTRPLDSLLFGVHRADPVTLAGVLGVLLAAGLLATLLPLRRATGGDPLSTIRTE